jgi:hypothetical protein
VCGEGERKRDGGPGRIVAPRQQHVYVPCTGNGVKTEKKVYVCAAPPRSGGTAEIRSGIIFTECVIVKFPSSLVEPFLSGGSVRTRRFDDETKVYHTRTLCHSDPRTKHRPLDRPSAAAFCCRILLPHSSAALRLCVLRPETIYQAVCQTLLRRVTLRRCRPADAASPMNLRVPLHGGRRRIILIIIEESRPRS